MCAYLLSIDASLAEGFVEEEFYEEEEENFDQYTNQGKPSCILPASPLASLILPMFYKCMFWQALLCLEKIIGLDASGLVLLSSRASSSA